jgi:hypothetical protein
LYFGIWEIPFVGEQCLAHLEKVETSKHSKAEYPLHNFCHILAWDSDSQQITFIEELISHAWDMSLFI